MLCVIKHSTIFLALLLLVACEAEQVAEEVNLPEKKQETIVPETRNELIPSKKEELVLLLFKKENKIELWTVDEGNRKKKIEERTVTIASDLPIGVFKAKVFSATGLTLHYPNAFYKRLEKKGTLSFKDNIFISNTEEGNVVVPTELLNTLRTTLKEVKQHHIIVFPNDARADGQLKTCIRCPKAMTEVYAQLELYVKDY